MTVRLSYPEGNLSGEEVVQCIGAASAHLRELGIKKGDRVALLSDNCPEYLIYLEAIVGLGAIAVLLHRRLADAELQRQIDFLDVPYLLHRDAHSSLRCKAVSTLFSLKDLHTSGAALPERNAREDASIVIFTSGSIGTMKAAALSEAHFIASAKTWANYYSLTKDDGYLVSLPLSTVGALGAYFRMKSVLGTVFFPQSLATEELVKDVARDEITCLSCVPTQLHTLLSDSRGLDALRSLRCLLVGGAKLSPQLLQRAKESKLCVSVPYGMTETASSITSGELDFYDQSEVSYSNGKVGSHLTLRILDSESMEPLGVGQPGLIEVSGDSLFCGYMKKGGEIEEVSSFCTGDLGSLDNEGNLYLHGRADRVMKSGGLKIFPDEIEDFLGAQEGIEKAAVLSYESEKWGERPVAYLQSAIQTIQLEAVTERFLTNFAKYKLPDKWIGVDRLPQTVSGKVDYATLRLCSHESSLFYRTLGDAQAPCLVLLHGTLGSGTDWYPLAESLSKDFFVVLPDMPGFGNSCRAEWFSELSFELLASELSALISDLNPQQLFLGGYSFGARMALLLASQLKREIDGLYLESLQLGFQDEERRRARTEQDELIAQRIERDGIQSFLEFWYSLDLFALETKNSLRAELIKERAGLEPSWVVQSFRRLSPGRMPYLGHLFKEVSCPTLVVTGERDFKFTELAREMPSLASSAIEHLTFDAGHMVHRERPLDVQGILRRFCRDERSRRK